MQTIFGIGIDVVDGAHRTMDEAVAARILSSDELKRFAALTESKAKSDFFFGRWAAKEAIHKAVGSSIPFNLITISNDESGKPVVSDFKGLKIMISISHDFAVFAAVAVAIKDI